MQKYKLILSRGDNAVDLYSDPNIRLVSTDGIGFSADITTSKIYEYDGAMYQGISLQQRSISIIVRYKPTRSETPEQAKNRLMELVGTKNEVMLRYIAPNRDVYINCRTEQVSTPPNAHPMNTQISFTCPDPYWRRYGDNSLMLAGRIRCWEFPCEIPQDTGMEFGIIRLETIVYVENKGTVESGATFTITALSDCSDPKIENIDTGEFLKVNVSLKVGDTLVICTEQGRKSIYFTHDGITENYFNHRDAGMTFFTIRPGINRFKYTFGSGDEHAAEIFLSFDTKYGGI